MDKFFVIDDAKRGVLHAVRASFSGTVTGKDLHNALQQLLPGLMNLRYRQRPLDSAEVTSSSMPNRSILRASPQVTDEAGAFIEVIHGPDTGRRYPLVRGDRIVGRNRTYADLFIDDPALESTWGILRVGSDGITLLAGESKPRKLGGGDTFAAGNSVLRIVSSRSLPSLEIEGVGRITPTGISSLEVDLGQQRKILQLALMVVLPLALGSLIAWLTGMWLFLLMSAATSLMMGIHLVTSGGESRQYRNRLRQALDRDYQLAHLINHQKFSAPLPLPTLIPVLGLGSRKADFIGHAVRHTSLPTLHQVPIVLPLCANKTYALQLTSEGQLRNVLAQLLLAGACRFTVSPFLLNRYPRTLSPLLVFTPHGSNENHSPLPIVHLRGSQEAAAADGDSLVLVLATNSSEVVQIRTSALTLVENTVGGHTVFSAEGLPGVPGLNKPQSSSEVYLDSMADETYRKLLVRSLEADSLGQPSNERSNCFSACSFFRDRSALIPVWKNALYATSLLMHCGYSLAEGQRPLELDINSDGPHFLLAGTTGSGKTQLLRSMLMSLAYRYPPHRVSFLPIDFKGGSGLGPFAHLPHTINVLDDLEPSDVQRALRFLRADLRKRESFFKEQSWNDYRDCLSHAQAQAEKPVFPELLIVVDEFKMLVESMPEAMSELMKIATVGRSLGLHLILSTQRPQGTVSSDIRANISTVLCLRVASPQDSINVLGNDRAAYLSPDTPGRGYLLRGAGQIESFSGAYLDDFENSAHVFTLELLGSNQKIICGSSIQKPALDENRLLLAYVRELLAVSGGWPAVDYVPLPPQLEPGMHWQKNRAEHGFSLGQVEHADAGVQQRLSWQSPADRLGIIAAPHQRQDLIRLLMEQAFEQHISVCFITGSPAQYRWAQNLPYSSSLTSLLGPHDQQFLLHLLTKFQYPHAQNRRLLIFDSLDLWLENTARDYSAEQAILGFLSETEAHTTFACATSSQEIKGRVGQTLTSLLLSSSALSKDPLRKLSKDYPHPAEKQFALEGSLISELTQQVPAEALTLAPYFPAAEDNLAYPKPLQKLEPLPERIRFKDCPDLVQTPKNFTLSRVTLGVNTAREPVSLACPRGQCTMLRGKPSSGKTTALSTIQRLNPQWGFLRIRLSTETQGSALKTALDSVEQPERTILLVDDLHRASPEIQQILLPFLPRFGHSFVAYTHWPRWMHSPILSALSGAYRGIVLQPEHEADLDTVTVFSGLPKDLRTQGKVPAGRAVLIQDGQASTLHFPLE